MNILVINYWYSQSALITNPSNEIIELASEVAALPIDYSETASYAIERLIEEISEYAILNNSDKPINGPTMVVQIF